jgi:hypothetical protein
MAAMAMAAAEMVVSAMEVATDQEVLAKAVAVGSGVARAGCMEVGAMAAAGWATPRAAAAAAATAKPVAKAVAKAVVTLVSRADITAAFCTSSFCWLTMSGMCCMRERSAIVRVRIVLLPEAPMTPAIAGCAPPSAPSARDEPSVSKE